MQKTFPIKYKNNNLLEIGDDFLGWNKTIKEIDLPNVKIIGNGFLYCNKDLTKLSLPK